MNKPTNHRDSICTALNLVRPVASSLATRRPAGMRGPSADKAMILLRRASDALEQALGIYDAAGERRSA